MIWDYSDEEIINSGKIRPFTFSSYEKAEKFIMDYNKEGVLKYTNSKNHTYTFLFDNEEWFKYKIFEVEVDKV